MTYTFTDAQEMHRKHPDTFGIPGAIDIAMIKPGSHVKICANDRERFWVKVTSRDGINMTGTIDNDLIFVDEHGLDYGDTVSFQTRHIYQVE